MSTRPLGRSLDPLPGESVIGYLLRLSCRLRVSPARLARSTGCAGHGFIGRRVLFGFDTREFARAARLTEDEALSLAPAAWADRYPPIRRSRIEPGRRIVLDSWLSSQSTRYCPQCLAGDASPVQQQYGGPWKKAWQLPVTFACTTHQRFLREGCPRAHRTGQGGSALIPYPAVASLHPAQCRLPPDRREQGPGRSSCIRLDHQPGEDGLPRPDPRTLNAQDHILRLLSPEHPAPDAARAFTDLRVASALVCLSWPLSEDYMNSSLASAVSEHINTASDRRYLDRQPRGILATAGILSAATGILASEDLERTLARHIPSGAAPTDTSRSWATLLKRHQPACSPAFRATALSITESRTTDRRKRRTPAAPTSLRYRQ